MTPERENITEACLRRWMPEQGRLPDGRLVLRNERIKHVRSLLWRVEQAEKALAEIAEHARKGKMEVESVPIDAPVWTAPNTASHWLSLIAARAVVSAAPEDA